VTALKPLDRFRRDRTEDAVLLLFGEAEQRLLPTHIIAHVRWRERYVLLPMIRRWPYRGLAFGEHLCRRQHGGGEHVVVGGLIARVGLDDRDERAMAILALPDEATGTRIVYLGEVVAPVLVDPELSGLALIAFTLSVPVQVAADRQSSTGLYERLVA
jgi:hypothetical protein